jgi:predicted membrane channel-forming protein YqfA (hemolysin III family)
VNKVGVIFIAVGFISVLLGLAYGGLGDHSPSQVARIMVIIGGIFFVVGVIFFVLNFERE